MLLFGEVVFLVLAGLSLVGFVILLIYIIYLNSLDE